MGYELHVSTARWKDGELALTVENRGVAPFYYDWPVELEAGGVSLKTDWKLSAILPGQTGDLEGASARRPRIYRVRVRNPMKGGKPLRFANREQGEEWLEINL